MMQQSSPSKSFSSENIYEQKLLHWGIEANQWQETHYKKFRKNIISSDIICSHFSIYYVESFFFTGTFYVKLYDTLFQEHLLTDMTIFFNVSTNKSLIEYWVLFLITL